MTRFEGLAPIFRFLHYHGRLNPRPGLSRVSLAFRAVRCRAESDADGTSPRFCHAGWVVRKATPTGLAPKRLMNNPSPPLPELRGACSRPTEN